MAALIPWFKKYAELYEKDRQIIKAKFPMLRYIEDENQLLLAGILHFTSECLPIIEDEFNIKVGFPDDYPESVPKVYEVGGRKEAIAKVRNVELGDMHFNIGGDGSACLSAHLDMRMLFPQGSAIDVFLEKLVAPFFYSLSYFERHGKFPFGEYSHGAQGIKESYSQALGIKDFAQIIKSIQLISEAQRLKAHRLCPCGSAKRIRDCHPKLFKRLLKLTCFMTPKEIRNDLRLLKDVQRNAIKSAKQPRRVA